MKESYVYILYVHPKCMGVASPHSHSLEEKKNTECVLLAAKSNYNLFECCFFYSFRLFGE